MIRPFLLTASAVALSLTTPAFAKGDVEHDSGESASVSQASPVRLVEWNGDWELMKESRRLRIWRTHIAYRLTVDAEGEVTNCEMVERFRMRHVSDSLCDVLSAHHKFEPALDENGAAVEGSYTDRISYADLRARL